MKISDFPRLHTAILPVALLLASAYATAGAAQSSDPEKRAKYEQMKLPELVRKANANDPAAQFELGSRFNYGRAAPKNNVEALRWLRRAGQNGDREAQRLLAVKLYNGYDIAADPDEALLWAQRLADAGDVPAQMMAGNMFANGEGSPRDLVQAYKWYDIAATTAQQTDDQLQQQAAVDARDRMGALLLPGEEVKAQELASDWWLRKQGVSLAPKAKPQAGKGTKKSSAKKKAAEPKSSATAQTEKPKAPEKPKVPGSPEAPVKPKVKTP